MITTASETRLCNLCCRRLPVTEFKLRSGNRGRERRCRECRNAYERELKARQRTKRRDKAVAEFVLEVNRARSHARITALVNEMTDHFGGLNEFIQAWKEQIDRLRQTEPTGKKVLDFYRAVIRLIEVSNASPPPRNDCAW